MTIGIYNTTDSVFHTPDKTASNTLQPRIKTQTFGDGYEQRAVDGINNINETFTLNYTNRGKEEIDKLIAFLNSKKGVSPISLTLPDSTQQSGERTVKVVTETYGRNFTNDEFYSADVTLRRVYEA